MVNSASSANLLGLASLNFKHSSQIITPTLTFSPNRMDWLMLYTGNPYVIQPGNVFFMHMILMDLDNELAMNLCEKYLVTENGNERLGKQKFDLVIL